MPSMPAAAMARPSGATAKHSSAFAGPSSVASGVPFCQSHRRTVRSSPVEASNDPDPNASARILPAWPLSARSSRFVLDPEIRIAPSSPAEAIAVPLY